MIFPILLVDPLLRESSPSPEYSLSLSFYNFVQVLQMFSNLTCRPPRRSLQNMYSLSLSFYNFFQSHVRQNILFLKNQILLVDPLTTLSRILFDCLQFFPISRSPKYSLFLKSQILRSSVKFLR